MFSLIFDGLRQAIVHNLSKTNQEEEVNLLYKIRTYSTLGLVKLESP